jgi:hypothetical protein
MAVANRGDGQPIAESTQRTRSPRHQTKSRPRPYRARKALHTACPKRPPPTSATPKAGAFVFIELFDVSSWGTK